jgi:hypothetical protein
MSDATHRWVDEMKTGFDAVKAIRDELKVQLHLAGMDAKAKFAELEHRIDSEQLTARKNLTALTESFRIFKDELGKQGKGSSTKGVQFRHSST